LDEWIESTAPKSKRIAINGNSLSLPRRAQTDSAPDGVWNT
jgi:hypothetical protein